MFIFVKVVGTWFCHWNALGPVCCVILHVSVSADALITIMFFLNIFVTFRCAFLEVLPNIQDVVSPTVWCFTFQLCWRSNKFVCTIIHMGMSQKWAPTIPMVIIMFPIKWQFLGVRNFEANPTSYCSLYLYSVISPFLLGKSCLKYHKIDIPRYEPYYEIYHSLP